MGVPVPSVPEESPLLEVLSLAEVFGSAGSAASVGVVAGSGVLGAVLVLGSAVVDSVSETSKLSLVLMGAKLILTPKLSFSM